MKSHAAFCLPIVWSAIFLVASLSACANETTKTVSPLQHPDSVPHPPVWLIFDLSVESVDVAIDTDKFVTRREASIFARREKGKAWSEAFSEALVTQLARANIPSRRATDSTHVPKHAVVIKGRFLSINEGDRLKRNTIGFGAGAEEISAIVKVYQQREGKLVRLGAIEAQAQGSQAPGVAGLILSAGQGAKKEEGMQITVENLAKKLVERGVRYYKKRGWL